MRRIGRFLIGIACLAITLTIGITAAQQQNQPQTEPPRQAPPQAGSGQTSPQTGTRTTETDNTRMNERDRPEPRMTADQQSENEADRKLSASIRKSITDDKTMSTYAKNVKIISLNGTVTLKGPVRSDTEKKAVEATASKIAGANNVRSEITIEPETR